jgi:hypothetical protein
MHTLYCWLASLFTSDRIIALATAVYAGVTIVMFRSIRSGTRAAHLQAQRLQETIEKWMKLPTNRCELILLLLLAAAFIKKGIKT